VHAVLARQRQAHILERIREDGAVRVADLVRELGVSDMTVRRDLEQLHTRGLVEKVHGGATSVTGSALFEPGFAAKSALQQAEKQAIAEAAVALVEPGVAVGVSAGTTTYAVARLLADVAGLTVVTNSIRVADVLSDSGRPDQTVVLTGGVRTPSDALVGPFAVSALQKVHLDLVFMGVHGMDVRAGFTSPNLLEAEANRAMIEAARLLVVVADHTKWGIVGLSSFARLGQADIVVTDAGIDAANRETLAANVRRLIIAGPDGSAARLPGGDESAAVQPVAGMSAGADGVSPRRTFGAP
jgi:DeoR/GlpR family transcriptional regulator of sugar metabolism